MNGQKNGLVGNLTNSEFIQHYYTLYETIKSERDIEDSVIVADDYDTKCAVLTRISLNDYNLKYGNIKEDKRSWDQNLVIHNIVQDVKRIGESQSLVTDVNWYGEHKIPREEKTVLQVGKNIVFGGIIYNHSLGKNVYKYLDNSQNNRILIEIDLLKDLKEIQQKYK